MLEKAIAGIEKHRRSFRPVSSLPPAAVEVHPFPSGSITLDKDTVGEHGQYLDSFDSTYLH